MRFSAHSDRPGSDHALPHARWLLGFRQRAGLGNEHVPIRQHVKPARAVQLACEGGDGKARRRGRRAPIGPADDAREIFGRRGQVRFRQRRIGTDAGRLDGRLLGCGRTGERRGRKHGDQISREGHELAPLQGSARGPRHRPPFLSFNERLRVAVPGLPEKGRGVRAHRQGRPHSHAGCNAAHARTGIFRLCGAGEIRTGANQSCASGLAPIFCASASRSFIQAT